MLAAQPTEPSTAADRLLDRLCRIRSTGASWPVKCLNCRAAWPTNMSTPVITSQPQLAGLLDEQRLLGIIDRVEHDHVAACR